MYLFYAPLAQWEGAPCAFKMGHGPERPRCLVDCTEFFWPRGDLGSARLVGQVSGLVAAQNGAPVIWLQPKIRFFLPFPFSGDVTSDQQQRKDTIIDKFTTHHFLDTPFFRHDHSSGHGRQDDSSTQLTRTTTRHDMVPG
jgi:hypothetical protein